MIPQPCVCGASFPAGRDCDLAVVESMQQANACSLPTPHDSSQEDCGISMWVMQPCTFAAGSLFAASSAQRFVSRTAPASNGDGFNCSVPFDLSCCCTSTGCFRVGWLDRPCLFIHPLLTDLLGHEDHSLADQ